MAEAILFPLAGKILSALSPLVLDQVSLPWYAKKELKKLEVKITTVRNVLLHAQELQKSNDAVKEWLRRLKNILYEADDLFDEVATEALRKEIIINKSTARKVRYFFTTSNPVLFNYVLGWKIKDVRERLDEICTDMRDFGFLVRSVDIPIIKRNEGTTFFVDTRNIFGRKDDKKRLLKSLLSSPDNENVHIIPIVGMGGLGKTTLAQMIFNDNALNNKFDKKLWVCVSDDFNVERILTEILKALGENVMNFGRQQLETKFQEKLSGKKYFLVLDDVWNDDPVKWKKMEELLMTGAPGSRVLVTTRDNKVAEIVGTMKPYVLKGLSEKECLSILEKWAFKKGEETKHPNLSKIGGEIVKKCGGVPLAARSLGVLLYSKTNPEKWYEVRDSEIWDQVQNENSVISILKLSYDQMSSSLKECFRYCSLFQKDEEISKEKLMYQWMAHGLIQPLGRESLEDVCESYLEELLRRSFLEYTEGTIKHLHPWKYKVNDRDYYKMHDLVHDLAQYVVGDEVLILKGENTSAASNRVRHVSLYNSSKVPNNLIEEKTLRTIVVNRTRKSTRASVEEAISHNRCVRVLDYGEDNENFLHNLKSKEVKHLRYLSCHGAKTIPKSLCELLNLLYLELLISHFDTFPKEIGNLRNLRVLMFSSSELICLPKEMQSLKSLRKLEILNCSKLKSLGGLGCITSLEHLEINGCLSVEYCDSDFQGLTSLKYLILFGTEGLRQLPKGLLDSAATLTVLRLKFCTNLELTEEVLPKLLSLEILDIDDCYETTCLPEGMQLLRKLTHLYIRNSSRALEERWKQGGLDWHKIAHVPHVRVNGRNVREEYSPDEDGYLMFSSSELICLPKEIQSLKSLRKLVITGCSKLKSLGGLGCITSLEHLDISGCHSVEFCDSDFQGLTSLKYLILFMTYGLKQLPKGLLDSAATLTVLRLQFCTNLALTEEVLPKLLSLERLYINGCYATKCLPEGMQLLRKLTHLYIAGLSAFAERCKQGGLDWHKIAHVPNVWVNWRNVREVDSSDEDEYFMRGKPSVFGESSQNANEEGDREEDDDEENE